MSDITRKVKLLVRKQPQLFQADSDGTEPLMQLWQGSRPSASSTMVHRSKILAALDRQEEEETSEASEDDYGRLDAEDSDDDGPSCVSGLAARHTNICEKTHNGASLGHFSFDNCLTQAT